VRLVARLALVIAFLGGGWYSEADPPDANWLKLTSANFELYTTASETSGRELIRHFEQIRRVLQPALGWQGPESKRAVLIAFRSSTEFRPYAPNDCASGFYLPGSGHDFIVMASASREDRTAAHEYGHLILSHIGWHLPAWLDEGLAELYSDSDFSGAKRQISVGQFIPGRVATLHQDGWIRLDELLPANPSSELFSSPAFARSSYAECWLLAHMLALDPRYAPRFGDLVAALRNSDALAAFATAYGKSLTDVERDLRAYLVEGQRNRRLVDTGSADCQGAIMVDRDAGFDARLALAEMLRDYPGRRDQARGAYQQLVRDYPRRMEEAAATGR
jgi:hypothetical protein